MKMTLDRFIHLSKHKVARLLRQAGSSVCGLPIKGTRRWFMLEYPERTAKSFTEAYLQIGARRHIEMYKMFFDHGLDTLLAPSFDVPLMGRGEKYMRLAAEGMSMMARYPDFLDFYKTYNVRVRFYGEYRKVFTTTPYANLCDLFDEVTAATSKHNRYRLFYGLFVQEPTQVIAGMSTQYYAEHGTVPDRSALVKMYYGEPIEPLNLFVSFGKPRIFDVPLLTNGKEDLYFTVSPLMYLTEHQLRDILYDHLYARKRTKANLQKDDWAMMDRYYKMNRGRTIGVGARHERGVWYPLPQVKVPKEFSVS